MKLKIDGNGNAVLAELNGEKVPVYIHSDGSEAPFDAASTVNSLNSRIQQNQRVEEELKGMKQKLQAFSGIEDPAAALKALGIVKNLDDKRLVDAGEVQRVKDETAAAFRGQLDEREKALKDLQNQLYNEIIGGAFSRSKVIGEKLAIPADFVRAYFGDHFGVEEGKMYAVDKLGNKIISRTRPGEYADFDEALMMLVEQHPQKNAILKGTGSSGSGAPPTGGTGTPGASGGKRQMLRSQFEAINDPVEKARVATSQEVQIVEG